MKDILNFVTSLPGILIVCGVVLLIIAMILFIVGNKKSKSEVKVEANTNVDVDTDVNINNESTPVVEEAKEVVPVEEVKVEEPVVEPTPVVEETAPVKPVISETPIFEPKVEEPTPEITITAPVEENNSIEIPSAIPAVQPEEPVQTEKAVYGGNEPVFDFKFNEEKPVSIYGGNDPLEKTQSIPKVEEHHEPYGGAQEINVVTPVEITNEPISIPEPTPVEQPAPSIPEFEPFKPVELNIGPNVTQTEEKVEQIEEL